MLNGKMFSKIISAGLLMLGSFVICGANRLIVQISPPPKKAFEAAQQDALAQSGKKSSKELPENLRARPITGGIQVNYAGARRYTEKNGRASFPLSHSAKTVLVVIAPVVYPRILSGSSVDHFALWQEAKPADVCAAMFEMRREKTAEGVWTWTVEAKTLPDDGKVANTAVIIQAAPESIFVPLGSTTSKQKQQCLLPTLFLLDRNGIDNMILTGLGDAKLDPTKDDGVVPYNSLESLREQIKNVEKDGKTVRVSNLPESSV
jgi:hypothetical protein